MIEKVSVLNSGRGPRSDNEALQAGEILDQHMNRKDVTLPESASACLGEVTAQHSKNTTK